MPRNLPKPAENDDLLYASENATPGRIQERRDATDDNSGSEDESIGDAEAQMEAFTSFRSARQDVSMGSVESLPEITGFEIFHNRLLN